MPAWSVPGRYSVLKPRMRCQRVRMSISVWSSMWPMCNIPVTFGGGITMEKTGPGAFASALNNASFTQKSAQRGSICFGSYALAISRCIPQGSPDFPARERKARASRRKVIFEYTGSESAPSIRQRTQSFSTWLVVGGNALQGLELGLVVVQLVFDERFDDRLQYFVRDLLQHFGAHFFQNARYQRIHVRLLRFNDSNRRFRRRSLRRRRLHHGRFHHGRRRAPARLCCLIDRHILCLVGIIFVRCRRGNRFFHGGGSFCFVNIFRLCVIGRWSNWFRFGFRHRRRCFLGGLFLRSYCLGRWRFGWRRIPRRCQLRSFVRFRLPGTGRCGEPTARRRRFLHGLW